MRKPAETKLSDDTAEIEASKDDDELLSLEIDMIEKSRRGVIVSLGEKTERTDTKDTEMRN